MSLYGADRSESDGLLAGLVSAAMLADLHLSMTLLVPGGGVSGQVVSPFTWLHAQAEVF